MKPIDFLRAVWPAEGHFCIATPFPNGGMNHQVFETIEAAAGYCNKVSAAENVYFATHTLKSPRIWNTKHHRDKETKEYVAGWSVRTQANTCECRILFFDLDVGASEPGRPAKYGSQLEAATGLVEFVRQTGLPRPMIVSSGIGLHVYWVLDRALASADEWLTQAQRLKQLATHYRLKFDPSRTTDQASVLRVAGTYNHKRSQKLLVNGKTPCVTIPVEEWNAALLSALSAINLAPKPEVETAPANGGLGSNTKMGVDIPPPPMSAILRGCAQMRRLATLKGCNSEPEWYWGDIGVVQFSLEGRAGVHKISQGYKDYSYAETEAKIDHWGDKGPTTCAKLAEVCGAALCEGCVYLKDNTSPAWVGHLLDVAPPPTVMELVGAEMVERAIPDPPAPYKRARTGGIEFLMETKEGKTFSVPIYPYDLYPLDRNAGSETEQQVWRAHLPHDTTKDISIEASTFVDDRALLTRLANNGIYPQRFPELKAYMSAYIQELQRLRPTTVQRSHLGWDDDHSKFVMPERIFRCDGVTEVTALSKGAAGAREFVCKKGTLKEQIRLLHFYDNPAYIPNQFIILAALGSPLYYMTGHHGVVINATGETGASKSTSLYAGASLWGPPLKYTLNATAEGATALYRDARRDILSNLPMCLDEITDFDDDEAKTFAMNATQPDGRRRLDRDGTPKQAAENERAAVTLTTANSSLHARLQVNNNAGSARSVRVFEIHFKKTFLHEAHEANAFLRGIKTNYGNAGEQFAMIVAANRDRITKRVIETMDRLGIVAKIREEERFWFAAAATVLVTGEIAVKMGLISWDIAAIERWLLDVQLPQMRGTVQQEIESASPIVTLMNYLEHINADMIKAVAPPPGANLSPVMQAARGEMLAHFELDTKVMYVLKDPFRRWCERRGLYSQAILRDLHAGGVVIHPEVRRVLGQNTQHAKGRSLCFALNMNHREITGVNLAAIKQASAPAPFVPSPGAKKPSLKVVP